MREKRLELDFITAASEGNLQQRESTKKPVNFTIIKCFSPITMILNCRSQIISLKKKTMPFVRALQPFQFFPHLMWSICGVCTLAVTVAKTSCYYDIFSISVPAKFPSFSIPLARWEHKRPQGATGTRGNGELSFIL